METDVFTSYGRASFRTTALPTLRHGVIYKHLTFLRDPGHYQVGGEASEAHVETYRVLCARLPALISVASPEGSPPGSALFLVLAHAAQGAAKSLSARFPTAPSCLFRSGVSAPGNRGRNMQS